MKKPSKDLGFTEACAWCKNILFRYLNIDGRAMNQEISCKHCGKPNKVVLKSMQKVTVTKIIVSILLLITAFSLGWMQSASQTTADIQEQYN